MKKIIVVLIMCFGLNIQAQKFKIESKAISEITIFKTQPNDTVNVEVLYKKEIVKMKLVIGIVRCTYSHKPELEGLIYKKILHYIYKDKAIDPKNILFSRRLNSYLTDYFNGAIIGNVDNDWTTTTLIGTDIKSSEFIIKD